MTIQPSPTYTQTKQDFLNSVLNKIGKQEFSNKTYKNPLSRLRGGFVEGPTDIEEIYVYRAEDTGFDTTGSTVLDKKKPTTKVQYHTKTVEHGYKTTVQNKEMRKGFMNSGSLGTMANAIITSLHTGSELDDYQDCLNVLKALTLSPKGDKSNIITTTTVTNEESAKEFTKTIKKTVLKMKDYGTVYSDVPSWAETTELMLFVDSDVDVEVQVEHLASAFNMSVAELNELSKIVIPNMKEKIGAIAVICHNKCLKINPCYYDLDSIKNTQGKFVNFDLVTETLTSYTTWYPYAIITDSLTTFNKMLTSYQANIKKDKE